MVCGGLFPNMRFMCESNRSKYNNFRSYFEILYSQGVEFQNFNRYMLDSLPDKESL